MWARIRADMAYRIGLGECSLTPAGLACRW